MDNPATETIFHFNLSIHPDLVADIVRYAIEGHVAEVAQQPGFLWGKFLDLNKTDERGWRQFTSIYGVESREALDAFLNGEQFRIYMEHNAPLADRMEATLEISQLVCASPE